MKALTTYQPYASLLACKAKLYETRSWRPSEKQLKSGDLLANHAAAWVSTIVGMPWSNEEAEEILRLLYSDWQRPSWGVQELQKYIQRSLPRGQVISVHRVLGFYRTEDLLDFVSDQERHLGDWRKGRWAWHLERVWVPFAGIVARGRQGLWDWTEPGTLGAELEALKEGRNTVVIELNPDYVKLASARCASARLPLFADSVNFGEDT